MWNSRKYTAMAVVGVGLAVAAATPASAQLLGSGGAYGYTGGCGAYGYAPVYGYAGGCGGYGAYGAAYGAAPAYAGVYSYGWPYGIIGDVTGLTVTRRSPVTPVAAVDMVLTATRPITVSPVPAARVATTAMAAMPLRGSRRDRTHTQRTPRGLL